LAIATFGSAPWFIKGRTASNSFRNSFSRFIHAADYTRTTSKASGLTSGTKYWFRVRAVGAAGLSGGSEPAQKMAA
jgi:hypothetical protein